jgi:hypothetical protein
METRDFIYRYGLSRRRYGDADDLRHGDHLCKVIPQISSKPNFGIAMGGEGLQAACCGIGWLKALNDSGLLTRARYVSITINSSLIVDPLLWAAGRYTQHRGNEEDDQDQLAKMIHSLLTNRAKPSLSRNFGHTISSSLMRQDQARLMRELKHKLFMLVANVSEGPDPLYIMFSPVNLSAPLMIINTGIVSDIRGSGGSFVSIPFESTALYAGVPIDIASVSKTSSSEDCAIGSSKADGTKSRCRKAESGGFTTDPLLLCILEAEFRSSAHHPILESIDSAHNIWPQRFCRQGFARLPTFDAATHDRGSSLNATDDTGILALLRRKVSAIVALCAVQGDIFTTDGTELPKGLLGYKALFGVLDTAWSTYQDQRQVFAPEEWTKMMTNFQRLKQEGLPLVCSFDQLSVLSNPKCGVESYSVNITFVFNGRCSKFRNPLVDVRRARTHAWNSFAYGSLFRSYQVDSEFPFVPSYVMHASSALVDALCGLSEWALGAGSPQLLSRLMKQLKCNEDICKMTKLDAM